MKPTLPLPIRLSASERPSLVAHFLSLAPEDRRLRFGSAIGDEVVREYLARLDFERDAFFAVTDSEFAIAGVVHVACTDRTAELGVSVIEGARGRGIGNALFARAVIHLRNRGVRTVHMHCLSENGAMMHLARKNGMRIVYDGGESQAQLALDAPTPGSYLTEWVGEQRAASAESVKRNTRLARGFLTLFAAPAP